MCPNISYEDVILNSDFKWKERPEWRKENSTKDAIVFELTQSKDDL